MSALLLEIIVCSVEDAIEAARGGADRLEIARDMARQGLTPPVDLVRRITREASLPVRVMVREHDDFRCDRAGELERLCDAAREFEALGVDGVVVGFVRDEEIDEAALRAVLAAAPRTRATFHRAFDEVRDPMKTLRTLKNYPQVDRVLSGGGEGAWEARAPRLRDLAAHAHPEIVMLPGGGIDVDALEHIARAGLREAHVGSAARIPQEPTAPVSAERVRELRRTASSIFGLRP